MGHTKINDKEFLEKYQSKEVTKKIWKKEKSQDMRLDVLDETKFSKKIRK